MDKWLAEPTSQPLLGPAVSPSGTKLTLPQTCRTQRELQSAGLHPGAPGPGPGRRESWRSGCSKELRHRKVSVSPRALPPAACSLQPSVPGPAAWGTARVHPLIRSEEGSGQSEAGNDQCTHAETSIRCCPFQMPSLEVHLQSLAGLSSQGGAPRRGGQGPWASRLRVRTSQLGGAGRPLHTSGVHTAQDKR